MEQCNIILHYPFFITSIFANSDDPDEMQQMLHFTRVYTVCKGKKMFRQKNTIFLKIIT